MENGHSSNMQRGRYKSIAPNHVHVDHFFSVLDLQDPQRSLDPDVFINQLKYALKDTNITKVLTETNGDAALLHLWYVLFK